MSVQLDRDSFCEVLSKAYLYRSDYRSTISVTTVQHMTANCYYEEGGTGRGGSMDGTWSSTVYQVQPSLIIRYNTTMHVESECIHFVDYLVDRSEVD